MKIINQLLVATNAASTVEALVIAKKLDVNIRVLLEIIRINKQQATLMQETQK